MLSIRSMTYALAPNYSIAFLLVGLMIMGTASFNPHGSEGRILPEARTLPISNRILQLAAVLKRSGPSISIPDITYRKKAVSDRSDTRLHHMLLKWKRIVQTESRDHYKRKAEFRDFSRTWAVIMKKITSIVGCSNIRDATRWAKRYPANARYPQENHRCRGSSFSR